MQAVELVKTLMADGVAFEADGDRIRWKSDKGPLPEDVLSALSAAKADVLAYLIRAANPDQFPAKVVDAAPLLRPDISPHPNPVRHIMERLEGDMEAYAAALREHGPMSYGQAMDVLGWGGTRAGQAEADLYRSGRIRFNRLGRADLVEQEGKDENS